MIRRVTPAIVFGAAALGLATWGGSAGAASSNPSSPGDSGKTVAVRQVGGIGRVLVDRSGDALYTPEQQAVCSGACNAFWKPLAPGSGAPTAAAGVGKLGVIKRPDGTSQVAINGKPLYSFIEDTPGKVNGNGFMDAFGSQHFTWHVVHPAGTVSTAGNSASKGSSGGGSGNGNSGASYGNY